MSPGKTYLKCKCPHCGAEVQYPDYAGGGASSCSQCGKTVTLPRASAALQPAPVVPRVAKSAQNCLPSAPQQPSPTSRAPAGVKRVELPAFRRKDAAVLGSSRSSFLRVCLWILNIAIVLAVVVVVANYFKNRPPSTSPEEITKQPPLASQTSPASAPEAPSSMQAGGTAAPTPSVPATPAVSLAPTPPPKVPKVLGDLKVTQVALDQPKGAKGSRLVYVTGVLKNDSDHQRFGVRLELDLFDTAGTKVGTATDYRQMLDPRATWQFRAIVTDRRAMAAKCVGVKEDE